MDINKYADLSTAHLSDQDRELFDIESSAGVVAYPYRYGWFVSTTTLIEPLGLIKAGYSQGLLDILGAAVKKRCILVCFDRDADVDDNFPTYNF